MVEKKQRRGDDLGGAGGKFSSWLGSVKGQKQLWDPGAGLGINPNPRNQLWRSKQTLLAGTVGPGVQHPWIPPWGAGPSPGKSQDDSQSLGQQDPHLGISQNDSPTPRVPSAEGPAPNPASTKENPNFP